jgi:hypothetical protein
MSTQIKRTVFKVTRPVKDSRRELKLKADIQFSLFIRLRDGACILCGSTRNLECSHYHGRGNPALKLDPLNSHAMCRFHNQAHNNNRKPYRDYMLRTYGQKALDTLEERSRKYTKYSDEDLRQKIKEFEDLVAILKDERSYA